MNAESIIKNRIVESITEFLLKESGYSVIRIAQEGLLLGVARRSIVKLNKSGAAGKLTTAPSFAVFNKNGERVVLVKVKFKGEARSGRNIAHGIKQILEYWPEAELLIVSPKKPHFYFVDSAENTVPIEEKLLQVKKITIAKFEGLIVKFFRK